MHIETSLVDGTFEFIQDPEVVFSEAQANIVNSTEAPNFDSEEPRSTNSIDTDTGKPRCVILLFYAIFLYFFSCVFKLLELIENLDA